MNRYLLILSSLILLFTYHSDGIVAQETDKQSIIIEVDGDPVEHQAYLEKYYPSIDVVAVYDQLLNGLALQAPHGKLSEISSLEFIKATHAVQTYEANDISQKQKQPNGPIIPGQFNTTDYTGKGIKVAVIDTGIDYHHPDLQRNYAGGYDLIDLDNNPMETDKSQGMPTEHGTHVAGIIAANGKIKGVAPDAELYAYRALGPGGSGSSIQVIAAMEKALKDGVDIMNLSLGNIVNGPDYPTSIAVNKAVEHGMIVVIANGNNGPNHWSIGSPATATSAVSVGAATAPQLIPALYAKREDKQIPMALMRGSLPWSFKKDYEMVQMDDQQQLHGKISLIERGKTSFYNKAKQAQDQGAVAAVIYNNEAGAFQGAIEHAEDPLQIPVASITKEDGDWLINQIEAGTFYIDTVYEETEKSVAPFSSRGPVTINWEIKPDILAPGTNIFSTVPGGYRELQGTSMAAPFVTGVMALMKEAHPNWSNEQIIGAIKTTALQIEDHDEELLEPISQGMGEIQIEAALKPKTIIDNPLLSFGKIDSYRESKEIELTIENTTNETQQFHFEVPIKQKGITWNLPRSFTLDGKERRKLPIELSVTTQQLENALYQGWLTLNQADQSYHLPYLFMSHDADYPKTMGFDFSLKPLSEQIYHYRLYVVEELKSVEVNLYQPDTLIFERQLLKLTDLQIGVNEGELHKRKVGEPGYYLASITIQLMDDTFETYETEIWIE